MSTVVVTPTAATRLRRARPALAILALVLVMFIVFLFATANGYTSKTLSIHNPSHNGSRAIARILVSHGLDVVETESGTHALDLMRYHEDTDPTLVVMDSAQLSTPAEKAIAKLKRVVIVKPTPYSSTLMPELERNYFTGAEEDKKKNSYVRVEAGETPIAAARAAQAISQHKDSLRDTSGRWQTAFPVPTPVFGDAFLYGERVESGSYRAAFASTDIFRNDHIAHFGNAALIVNSLTAHSTVPIQERGPIIVLHPSIFDELTDSDVPEPTFMAPSLVLGFIAMCAWGLSRGRKLGRLVPEDLPTYVPAAETVTGRGRLLYRNRQASHAARLLRLDTARRLSRRLGLPASSSAETLRAALAAAGATPQRIEWLWGPEPVTEDDLVALSEHLSALEKEIRP